MGRFARSSPDPHQRRAKLCPPTISGALPFAGGWIADTFIRPFSQEAADAADGLNRDLGHPAEQVGGAIAQSYGAPVSAKCATPQGLFFGPSPTATPSNNPDLIMRASPDPPRPWCAESNRHAVAPGPYSRHLRRQLPRHHLRPGERRMSHWRAPGITKPDCRFPGNHRPGMTLGDIVLIIAMVVFWTIVFLLLSDRQPRGGTCLVLRDDKQSWRRKRRRRNNE